MQNRTSILILPALIICFLIETVCVTYALKFPHWVPFASVVYFISGITIGMLFLKLPQSRLPFSILAKSIQTKSWYKLLLVLLLGFVMHHFTKNWIIDTPLTIYDADMLPVMKVMCERFLQGAWSTVYNPIPEIWGGIQPIYLPAMWLPFTTAVAGNFDLRWITTGGLLFSFSVFLLFFKPVKPQVLSFFLLLSAFILFWWLQTEEVHNFIRLSEEGIIVCYFSLLVVALLSGNYYFIGLAAALCALSRYALAGWLPAMIVYLLFVQKNKKQLLAFVITGLGVGVLLVILPFGVKVIQTFMALPALYIEHANRVWKDNPEFFKESMGFAKFFGPDKTNLLHRVLITAAFGVPLLFMGGCYVWQHVKKRMLPNIPLACLKISLVVFYNFLDVPYLYLFYTSSFISLIAIGYFMFEKEEKSFAIS